MALAMEARRVVSCQCNMLTGCAEADTPGTRQGDADPVQLSVALACLESYFPADSCTARVGDIVRDPTPNSCNLAYGSPPGSARLGVAGCRATACKRPRHSRGSDDTDYPPRSSRHGSCHHLSMSSSQSEQLSDQEAADVLVTIASTRESDTCQQPDAPGMQVEAPAACTGLLINPAAVASRAILALAAQSRIPHAKLAIAAAQLAQYYFGKQAELNAKGAGSSTGSAPASASCGAAWLASEAAIASSLHTRTCSTPKTPCSRSAFAAYAGLPPVQEAASSEPATDEDGGGVDETAAFSSCWTQHPLTSPQALRTRPPQQHTQALPDGMAAGQHNASRSFLQHSRSALTPSLPSPAALGGKRLHTFERDNSLFSRDIFTKISPEVQEPLRQHWASTGRVAVTCGMVGQQGVSGIFTLDRTGRPVIWAPRNSSAAIKLPELVAAGGGSDVPEGFDEMEPKVFEELAGKARTHNWQLSINVADFYMLPTPKNEWPPLKLGHLVRIVGIPTAK